MSNIYQVMQKQYVCIMAQITVLLFWISVLIVKVVCIILIKTLQLQM